MGAKGRRAVCIQGPPMGSWARARVLLDTGFLDSTLSWTKSKGELGGTGVTAGLVDWEMRGQGHRGGSRASAIYSIWESGAATG